MIFSQNTIKVDVDYYNGEREAILRYAPENEIERLITEGIEIPTAEFLTYYLFYKKRMGSPQFRDYTAIGRKTRVALTALEDSIEWTGHSICTAQGVTTQDDEITEHIGESIGLAIISRIHQLASHDWEPIEEQHGWGARKSFDFRIASTGEQFIEVENKGSSVQNNRKISEVKGKKYEVKVKKDDIKKQIEEGIYQHPTSLRYGTITAVDPRHDRNVKCWLVDPEPEKISDTPKRFKLLTRMGFLRDWISFISPDSQLASAITIRVADLETRSDPFILDNIPLRRKNGDLFNYNIPFIPLPGFPLHSKFFSKKSRVTDGPAGGVVFQISDNELFFIGIMQSLVTLTANQNFSDILNYKHEHPGTVTKYIECVFNRQRFKQLRLPLSIIEQIEEKKNIIKFYLSGQIHYSSSGLVFGILPIV
jgi:hypothetical protein